jgi:hypothetical protein
MPDPESLRRECFIGNPVKARDGMEYRKALVGDVHAYLRGVEWWEAMILASRLRPANEEPLSWEKIVKILSQVDRPYPKYMRDKRHVRARYYDAFKPLAEDHFRREGYLV